MHDRTFAFRDSCHNIDLHSIERVIHKYKLVSLDVSVLPLDTVHKKKRTWDITKPGWFFFYPVFQTIQIKNIQSVIWNHFTEIEIMLSRNHKKVMIWRKGVIFVIGVKPSVLERSRHLFLFYPLIWQRHDLFDIVTFVHCPWI